ncbi:calcium-activated chloride channel regulator 4-like [Dreissena polymorpha]|uniref:calcium-activated chloride channel regulator 4-like n=1 Tax=Dreissena polymorpha TaxID=45954 RepID=UPI002263D0EB|nr:calcium-activated chloride channel regulator 4-like [Dreissena polymorpha]
MTGSHIIKEKLPLGSWLGIVWFNDDADEFAKITQINNDDDRQSLMLQRKFGTAENSEIILMSDGQDNDPLKLEEATLNAKQAKVTIHTVSISQEADQRMIDLAVSTGGNAPVVNVDVFAQLDEANGTVCNLTLKDDGLAEVEVNVIENNFQRLSIPEPLFVENLPPTEDIDLPPGRITDLSVVDIKTKKSKYGESRNFTIAWTATGSDLNVGQASAYDIRIAEDIDTILQNFTNAQRFEVGNGTLSPKPSGSAEAIRISVNADESYTGTAFLGIVVADENNNTGKLSNVVSILVAKGFRIKVEEVANYTKGMFDDKPDLVDKESKSSTRPVNYVPPLAASSVNVVCLFLLLSI